MPNGSQPSKCEYSRQVSRTAAYSYILHIFLWHFFLLAFQKHTKSQNIIKAKIAKAITENIFFAISP